MFLNLHLFYVKLSFISKFIVAQFFSNGTLVQIWQLFNAQNLTSVSIVSEVKLNIKTFTLLQSYKCNMQSL